MIKVSKIIPDSNIQMKWNISTGPEEIAHNYFNNFKTLIESKP